MREHFYNVVLIGKMTGRVILNVGFGKNKADAFDLFCDLANTMKKTKAKLVLYEDKGTSREREYLVN